MEKITNKVILTQGNNAIDITNFVTDFSVSGDVSQVTRKATVNMLYPMFYKNRLNPEIKKSRIQIFINNQELYRGYMVSKDMDANGQSIKLEFEDNLMYIKKNDTIGTVRETNENTINQIFKGTPEAITKSLLNTFNLPIGNLASTGKTVSYIANGKTLYDVIINVYKLASKSTGSVYYIISEKDKISVIEKGKQKSGIKFTKDNLLAIQSSMSIGNMVNRVVAYDNEYNLKATVQNQDDINNFGLFQKIITGEQDDYKKAAEKELKKIERKINITVMGNIYLKTGYACDVVFPDFNINTTLYIESDSHEFNNGHYQTKLTLLYENEMEGEDG